MRITIRDEHFILDPSGALFWESKRALMLADIHLGKITHFRKHGIAVPRAPIADFYVRIEKLIQKYRFHHLYFLGDLFHSHLNSEWDTFVSWSQKQSFQMTLISGNHDILPAQAYQKTPLEVVENLVLGEFILTHHPENHIPFNFCGHIHPGIMLRGHGRQRLKVSCFFQRPNQLILPAFGAFTGLHLLTKSVDDKVYLLGEKEVFAYPDEP